jgi:hypothetical protein
MDATTQAAAEAQALRQQQARRVAALQSEHASREQELVAAAADAAQAHRQVGGEAWERCGNDSCLKPRRRPSSLPVVADNTSVSVASATAGAQRGGGGRSSRQGSAVVRAGCPAGPVAGARAAARGPGGHRCAAQQRGV